MFDSAKIAIVYDWIDKWGGVERVLLTLHEMFPEAPFFTSYYDSKKATWAKDLKIKTSFIQKLPKFIRGNRLASLPFYSYAFESFDFRGYDLVISVTSSFAKGIVTRPETLHVCYLLTPTRYLWVNPDLYINKSLKFLTSNYLTKMKQWDFVAAQRPDHIISLSQTVADRCQKFYQRKSEVIYPPFDVEYWKTIKNVILGSASDTRIDSGQARMTIKNKNFFLVVSRLEPYKRIELVLQYFKTLEQKLVVVGEGSREEELKQVASSNVTFLKKISDQELGYLYSNAEALIMPQEEDFGYVALEAQFFGCPVIAYKKGGATETIIENKTGLFFTEQSVDALEEAINKFDMIKLELKKSAREFGAKNAERFSKEKFIKQFFNVILERN